MIVRLRTLYNNVLIMGLSSNLVVIATVLCFHRVVGNGYFQIPAGTDGRATLKLNDTATVKKCAFPEHLKATLHSPQLGVFLSLHLNRHQLSEEIPTTLLLGTWPARSRSGSSSIYQNILTSYTSSGDDAHLIFDCKKKSRLSVTGVILYGGEEYILSTAEDDPSQASRHGSLNVHLHKLPNSHLTHDYIRSEKSRELNAYYSTNSPGPKPMRRSRRDVRYVHDVTTFTIDVLVVVDNNVFAKWLTQAGGLTEGERILRAKSEIQKYYMHVIQGVDLRYKSIGFLDFQIGVRLAGIVIVEREILGVNLNSTEQFLAPPEGNAIDADVALRDFRSWINITERLPEHDHAILFTGYDLYSTTEEQEKISHTSGLAFIGTLCEADESLSIVEEQGGFQSIGTAAHEIGHSLGALHDGENNTCFSEDRYIMAASGFGPTPENKKYNPWFFSECSVEYFREFIAHLLAEGSSCLLQTNTSHVIRSPLPSYDDVSQVRALELPGQYYSPDEQCRMIWGRKSYLCRGAEFGNASTICTAMYCRDPSTTSDCVLHMAARGTSCGNKQWCIRGKCVYSQNAPEKSDTCVLGDQPGPAFNELTCEELVKQSPSYCYQEKVRARCCRSCGLHNTRRNGCEFGDRMTGCQPWHCNDLLVSRNIREECCGTCQIGDIIQVPIPTRRPTLLPPPSLPSVHRKQTTCDDVDSLLGNTCRGYVRKHGAFVCYSNRTFNACCKTCTRLKKNAEGCEFGDRVPSLCEIIANRTTVSCEHHGHNCCGSCVKTLTTEPTTSSSFIHNSNLYLIIIFSVFKYYFDILNNYIDR